MRKVLLPTLLLAAATTTGFAQLPEAVLAEGFAPASADAQQRVVPCALNDAGTLIPGAATAQSNDLSLDTLFLCFGDEILIDHNGDQRLDGDPDPSTRAGVGYAWYECRPSVDGPTLGAVAADPCLIDNPGAPAGTPDFFISTGGSFDGDVSFFNQGAVQTFFNFGNPLLVWFAPITFDSLEVDGTTNTVRYENGGSCVSVSADAAFAVVYLNELTADDLQVDNCTGSFAVDGGLPGWRAGDVYDIEIVNDADPSIRGTVGNPDVSGGSRISFSVPEPGTYTINVTDAKSCETASLSADMTACVLADRVKVTIDTIIGAPGSTVCVPVTVEGFQNIVSFQFGIDYDEVLLRFDGFQNPGISPFTAGGNYNDNGSEVIIAGASFGTPYAIADGDLIFEICFEVLGLEGEFAPVLDAEPISGIEFANTSGTMDYAICTGGVVITTNTIALLAEQTGEGCGGEDENFFTARVFGGVAPYTVTWELQGSGNIQGPQVLLAENQPFATAANLAPGVYDIRATDAGGNTDLTQLTITDGPALGVFIDRLSSLRCFGDANGALFAVPTLDFTDVDNPGSDYAFAWSTGAMTQGINGLDVGNYEVTVTDSRGCTATTDNTITAPAPLDVTVAATDATCTGLNDGEVRVNVTGGTPMGANYTFTYTTPDGTTASTPSNNLTINAESGPYAITVVDDNGCREDATVTVGARRAIGLAPTVSEIACAGDDNGEITVVASATLGTANPPFQFTWFGAPGAVSTATQSTLGGLGQGTYRVVAEDADGCIARDTFTLVEPQQLQIALDDFGPESCDPGGDGFAAVSAVGGRSDVTGYTFEWRDADYDVVSDMATATGLAGGSYTGYVIDESGCIDSLAQPLVITTPERPVIQSLDDDRLDCNGFTDGTLTVAATPGAAAIDRIEWSNGGTGTIIENLAAGTYEVAVTDADGCVTRQTAEVIEPDPLSVDDATLVPPACFEGGDGSIAVDIAGGTGPFTYTWSDGTTGVGENSISGPAITAGTYIVTVTDANDCPSLTETYELDDPEGINPTESNLVAASCAAGVDDGQLTVSAELPGDPAATFLFEWSSGESGAGVSSTATMLQGGRITVAIQEASQACPPQEFSYEIPAPDPLVPNFAVQEDVRCFGESSGRILIDEVTGGTPGFTFAWTYDGQTFNGNELNDIPAATVALEISDANGCTLSQNIEITQPDELTLELDAPGTLEPTCAGSDDGIVSLVADGGNLGAPYTFSWNDDPNRNSAVARDLGAGTYTVLVTDFKGCTDELVYTLTEPEAIEYELSAFEDILCFGDLTEVTVENAFGGQGFGPEDYLVSVNGSSFQPIGTAFQVPGGVPLPITVIDPAECAVDDELLIPAPPAITVRLPTEVEVELGDSIRLRPDIFPGGAPIEFDSIRWTPDTLISFRNGNLADPYVRPLSATTYTVTVRDEDGCTQSASVLVNVDRNRNVFIPNAFSPNNDSNNDNFKILTGPGVQSINYLRIFNRWGEALYAQEDVPLNDFGQEAQWDGTFRGRRVPEGVYVYVAEVTFLDGDTFIYKGDVTVVY